MGTTCVAVVVAAALALTAMPSSAQRPTPRTVTVAYQAGSGLDCERRIGCVALVPKKGETSVRFRVQDASGTPVYGTVGLRRRTSFQFYGEGEEFCGEGAHPAPGGRTVYVYFENHLGSWHGCPGGASRGVVKATFSR